MHTKAKQMMSLPHISGAEGEVNSLHMIAPMWKWVRSDSACVLCRVHSLHSNDIYNTFVFLVSTSEFRHWINKLTEASLKKKDATTRGNFKSIYTLGQSAPAPAPALTLRLPPPHPVYPSNLINLLTTLSLARFLLSGPTTNHRKL